MQLTKIATSVQCISTVQSVQHLLFDKSRRPPLTPLCKVTFYVHCLGPHFEKCLPMVTYIYTIHVTCACVSQQKCSPYYNHHVLLGIQNQLSVALPPFSDHFKLFTVWVIFPQCLYFANHFFHVWK